MPRMVASMFTVMGLAIVAAVPGQSRAANLTTLVSFCALPNCADGQFPYTGSLIADANGDLFGTTIYGGAHGGGTVFEILKTASGYASAPTVLVGFCSLPNCADGQMPYAGLIADADGNLFGTTSGGGEHDNGTVFEIAKTKHGYASTPTTLVSFCSLPNCADGRMPYAGLIADADGNLFGTTSGGGEHDNGTVFEIAKTKHGYASTPTTLVSFNGDNGDFPLAGLIADAKGNLFGTTSGGGAHNEGTVFEIAKTDGGYASTPTTLVSFNGDNGLSPRSELLADADGNLFGTTDSGGAHNWGTVFEIVKTATGYASAPITLVNFCEPECAGPAAPASRLIADAKNNLFGTTEFGGAHGWGTVFEILKTASGYANAPTVLVSFCALGPDCADGAAPLAGLIADADGNLFGTTIAGGAYEFPTFPHAGSEVGTVFEIINSGFVVPAIFAGTPENPNCKGKSVSALARQYGGLNAAAAALGYPSVRALQNAIVEYCEG
jgi:uncharacterized repeat protein (TIGR03803 family)